MINLFLLGQKGLNSLHFLEPSLLQHINIIIIGRDPNILEDYSKEVASFALKNYIPHVFRKDEYPVSYESATFNIAIGWRWLIKDSRELIVFHDSILPKYRGFNPLVSALINGDEEIGVTAIRGVEDYDAGEIIDQRILKIDYPIKIKEAIELISKEYGYLLSEIVTKINSKSLTYIPQEKESISYSLWRDEEDYRIDWNLSAQEICRFIDALGFPYQGAKTYYENIELRIFDAIPAEDVRIINRQPGKVIFKEEGGFTIVCGQGLIYVSEFFNNNEKFDLSKKFRIRFK